MSEKTTYEVMAEMQLQHARLLAEKDATIERLRAALEGALVQHDKTEQALPDYMRPPTPSWVKDALSALSANEARTQEGSA